MAIATVYGWDATGSNLVNAPKTGQGATYVTGSGNVPASSAQLAVRPGILKYDQSPVEAAIDFTCDLFDFETGCLTVAILADVIKKAQANYKAGKTRGQRNPAVYASRSNVSLAVNTLVAGGVTSCPLVVADWNNNPAAAAAEVATASGPFPIVGRQYSDVGAYDLDVWSAPWVNTQAGPTPAPPPPPVPATVPAPPGQWGTTGWTWAQVEVTGKGLDGNLHTFQLDLARKIWIKLA